MIIEDIAYQRYSVPFRVPFTTSHGLEQSREGLMVRVTDERGLTGYGEAVSLPSFGTANLDELERTLVDLIPRLDRLTLTDAFALVNSSSNDAGISPVLFALDTALLDIQARAAGLSIARLIKPDAAITVPLNATITDIDPQGAASAAYYAVTAGYSAVKLKIGVSTEPSLEVERVAAVREAISPETQLRLDVNGAWSIERAIEISRTVEPYDIAYLEQPLPAADVGTMARLRQEIGIPLAADESATNQQAVQELIEMEAADVIIVKPAIAGGIKVARELVHLAESADMQVVVTTSLESGVGITAALHLAATLPEPIPACGLATGALLESDLLVESPAIEGGQMSVPTSTGLGVEPIASIWNGSLGI
jgi:L-Ala-D/L-Glu epimerase